MYMASHLLEATHFSNSTVRNYLSCYNVSNTRPTNLQEHFIVHWYPEPGVETG